MFTAYAEAAASAASAASSGNLTVMFIPVICFLVIFLIIWFGASKNFAAIAADKGYTEKKWFHYCFWMGLIGMLMVCAMPDKKRRQ
ncbi:MAG: hypothetical protein IIW08_03660 [Clostridia bacterium]|nr:hypothetical protein [Clostridia bacterium]